MHSSRTARHLLYLDMSNLCRKAHCPSGLPIAGFMLLSEAIKQASGACPVPMHVCTKLASER